MKLVALLGLLVCLAAAMPARASTARRDAKRHYDRAMAFYAVGEFDAAVAEFKLAYERAPAAALLFNLAQASRLGKRPQEALHFYRSYLRLEPGAANRADVERRIAELELVVREAPAALDAALEPVALSPTTSPPSTASSLLPASPPSPSLSEPANPPAAATPPPPAPPVAAAPAPSLPLPPSVAPAPATAPRVTARAPTTAAAAPRTGRAAVITGLTSSTCGLVAAGVGIYFGVAAEDANRDLLREVRQQNGWSPWAQRRYDDGRRDSITATTLYAVGGVAAAVGAVVAAVGWRDQARRSSFAVSPTAGGAQAVFLYAF